MTGRNRHAARPGRLVRLVAGGTVVAAVVLGSAGGALAGEVKGPPGQIENTDTTAAGERASSACAASGLNDYDLDDGQNERQVQTPADAWRYYGLPKGAPGKLGLCRGGGAR